jgi:hypothetical protein
MRRRRRGPVAIPCHRCGRRAGRSETQCLTKRSPSSTSLVRSVWSKARPNLWANPGGALPGGGRGPHGAVHLPVARRQFDQLERPGQLGPALRHRHVPQRRRRRGPVHGELHDRTDRHDQPGHHRRRDRLRHQQERHHRLRRGQRPHPGQHRHRRQGRPRRRRRALHQLRRGRLHRPGDGGRRHPPERHRRRGHPAADQHRHGAAANGSGGGSTFTVHQRRHAAR